MDLSAAAHHQHPFSHQLPEFSSSPVQESSQSLSLDNNNKSQQEAEQKKPKAPETEPQQCPRCESTNTKFCYFNNYSLTQPRYFCKACRRYWTKGGTLRNVPVGGGCRKSAKRPASNSPNQYLKRPHTAADTNPNLHGYSAGMLTPNYSDAGILAHNYFANQTNFLQDLNNYSDGGAFMFQNSLCNNYDEIVAGNSNSGSVISDEMAALAPYGGVKQESVENAAFWELPWQNGITTGEVEPVRDNWNGLYANYSVLGLLNSPALM